MTSGVPPVWKILQDFGFVPDSQFYSEPPGGLRYDLGPTALNAIVCQSLEGPVVMISGLYYPGSVLAEIEIELPQHLDSPEFVAAYLSYRLDSLLRPGFESPASVPWLTLGRRNQDLLPWEVDRVAYELRPQCVVQREWMKLAIRELRKLLVEVSPEEPVLFSFDGEALRMTVAGQRVLVPAKGRAWREHIAVQPKILEWLPKRWKDPIYIDYRRGHLGIGNRRYSATTVASPGSDTRKQE